MGASRRNDDESSASSGPSFRPENLSDDDDDNGVLSSGDPDIAAIECRSREIREVSKKHVRLGELEGRYGQGEALDVDEYKFLIASRGGNVGRAKIVKGLKTKWKAVEKNAKVWTEDVVELEKELVELAEKLSGDC